MTLQRRLSQEAVEREDHQRQGCNRPVTETTGPRRHQLSNAGAVDRWSKLASGMPGSARSSVLAGCGDKELVAWRRTSICSRRSRNSFLSFRHF